MDKCIHKPIHHAQTPKTPREFTYEPVWQSSNHHMQKFAELPKHLENFYCVRIKPGHWCSKEMKLAPYILHTFFSKFIFLGLPLGIFFEIRALADLADLYIFDGFNKLN